MKATLAVLLCLMAGAAPAWASLGQPAATVNRDQQQLGGRITSSAGDDFTVQQLTLDNGTVIREYVSAASGVVVGIAWQGPSIPNLAVLLGLYYPLWQQAAQAAGPHHGPLTLHQANLEISSGGHAGSFSGRACLINLLPAGLTIAAIR